MTLKERIEFVIASVGRGYLIGQWDSDHGYWLASHENKTIGFYLHEVVESLDVLGFLLKETNQHATGECPTLISICDDARKILGHKS